MTSAITVAVHVAGCAHRGAESGARLVAVTFPEVAVLQAGTRTRVDPGSPFVNFVGIEVQPGAPIITSS